MVVGEETPSLTRRPNLEVLECRDTNVRVEPEDLYRVLRSGGIMHSQKLQNLCGISSPMTQAKDPPLGIGERKAVLLIIYIPVLCFQLIA